MLDNSHLPNVLKCVAKKLFESDFPALYFVVYQTLEISLPDKKPRDLKQETGMIVTLFQEFKLRGKQISQSTFSYCEVINSPRNGTKVPCL